MTVPTPPPAAAELATGDADFDAYAASLDETSLLGHLVLYSVFDGPVTRDDVEAWFSELGLDDQMLPPPLRHVDAFERVTGRDGVRLSYPIDDPTAIGPASRYGRRRAKDLNRIATLMVRAVRRDSDSIVRHVVREVRDEQKANLTYDTCLAVCTFRRATNDQSPDGAGTLHIQPNARAIAKLPQAEQDNVSKLIKDIEAQYQRRCAYLSSDRLRSVVRRYVESLNAIRVRPTGGVYFVHRRHAPTLAALREVVSRLGKGSNLVRVPIPDQEEMREMIIQAFTTRAKDDLDQLAADIAAAQRSGKAEEVEKLYDRFKALKNATAEHSELLATSLDDTQAALDLVNMQLGALLTTAPDDDEDDDE